MDDSQTTASRQLHQQFFSALRGSGLRLTTPRRRITAAIIGLERPAKVDDIRRRAGLTPAQLVTAYRTVEKLCELELVRKLHTENGTQLFMVNPDLTCRNHAGHSSHPSLLCRHCHTSYPLPPIGQDFMRKSRETAARLGFSHLKISVEFSGICPRCRE